jgi:uncharacterized damage-inducible protein DinB
VTEPERLAEQLQRSFEGEAWHGPSLLQALEGVTAEQAHAHPIAGAHSIWELVLHLASDYGLVRRRLKGDGRPVTPAEGWPPVPEPTEANWQYAIRELKSGNAEMRRTVLAFPPERLDAPIVPDPPYSAYVQFIGITQHALYHTGQIVLLKRALTT